MPLHLKPFLVVLLAFLLFSCSSSHSSNDSDIIPDADADTQDSETIDNSDSQEAEIIDDSDEQTDEDNEPDSEEPDDEEPDKTNDEIFEETEPINGYKRCYDKIPAGPYEGLFADPNLELQIKMHLWNKNGLNSDYELQKEDLEYLKKVSICTKDLRGIEKLINLESIAITGGNVYDFAPLLKLKKLKTVRIDDGNRDCGSPFPGIFKATPLNIVFENITCLDGSFSQLTDLETVLIYNTDLKDVSPVEQLVNLTSLTMNNNDIESLPENIGHLQKLKALYFSNNNMKDIEPIQSLINLKKLNFGYNNIENISPVKELTNLDTLVCNGNKINDISPVTNLENLTKLELNSNMIEEIPKEITNLKKLQYVDLSYNNISSLPDLEGLNSLVTVLFYNNTLNDEDLIKIGQLENAKQLHLAENRFTKVPVLKNMKSVNILYISRNKIADLAGFADEESFPALEKLYLDSNKIENVEALRNRKGLTELRIYKNCIKDLSPLEELKANGTYIDGMNEQLESCEDTTTLEDGE